PGPPRAFVVIARSIRSSPRNPAKRPASDTEKIFTTASGDKGDHHPQRQAANQIEFQSHNREVRRNKEGERDLSYRVQRFREQPALLVYDSEAGKKRGKYQADIERPSDHTISKKNCKRIAHWRVLRDDVEPRLVQ